MATFVFEGIIDYPAKVSVEANSLTEAIARVQQVPSDFDRLEELHDEGGMAVFHWNPDCDSVEERR